MSLFRLYIFTEKFIASTLNPSDVFIIRLTALFLFSMQSICESFLLFDQIFKQAGKKIEIKIVKKLNKNHKNGEMTTMEIMQ